MDKEEPRHWGHHALTKAFLLFRPRLMGLEGPRLNSLFPSAQVSCVLSLRCTALSHLVCHSGRALGEHLVLPCLGQVGKLRLRGKHGRPGHPTGHGRAWREKPKQGRAPLIPGWGERLSTASPGLAASPPGSSEFLDFLSFLSLKSPFSPDRSPALSALLSPDKELGTPLSLHSPFNSTQARVHQCWNLR